MHSLYRPNAFSQDREIKHCLNSRIIFTSEYFLINLINERAAYMFKKKTDSSPKSTRGLMQLEHVSQGELDGQTEGLGEFVYPVQRI